MIETHLSFTLPWECDENGHMNVQFFLKRFEEANQVILSTYADPQTDTAKEDAYHIRFHREVHAGDATKIASTKLNNELNDDRIVHYLIRLTDNTICASCINRSTVHKMIDSSANEVERDMAEPHGLDAVCIDNQQIEKLFEAYPAMTSNISLVRSDDLRAIGTLFPSRIVSRFSDAAPHIWENFGITSSWLKENNFGRVAVEMQLNVLGKPALGTSLRLHSSVSEVAEKTFKIVHALKSIETKEILAVGAVRCLVMDLNTRKACSLPNKLIRH